MIISEKLNVPRITLEVVTFSENAKEKALVRVAVCKEHKMWVWVGLMAVQI